MAQIWRVVDTGLGSPARNIALNRALLEARHAEEISSTLRFGRSTCCVLLGYFESSEQVADVSYCRTHDIPIQRRATSGSAAYVHDSVLLWELYVHRRDVDISDLRVLARRICHAAATAISALGIDARYRSRSEIEVEGRTIATGSFAVDGNAILFQAVLVTDSNLHALKALRLPCDQRSPSAVVAAAERTTSLKEVLGREPSFHVLKHNLVEAFESEFDIEFREGDISLTEEARYQIALRQIETADWISLAARPASEMPLLQAAHQHGNGILRAMLLYDIQTQTVRQVWFSGDIAIKPRRALLDLEAMLRDVPVGRLTRRIEWFFASRSVEMHRLAPNDFLTVVRRAIQQPLLTGNS